MKETDMARPRAPKKEPKPIVTTKAPAVEELAKELIEKDHPSLKLAGIVYGFFGEGKKLKSFGKVRAIPETTRTLLSKPGTQFEVIVSPDRWNRFSEQQRRQALDALLCSMSYDGKVARIEKPDFKGYRANILRYAQEGLAGYEEFAESFRGIQLTLPEINTADADVSPVPATVDPETGEYIEQPSVTITMGDTTAVLTPETAENITKALNEKKAPKPSGKSSGEQKPRFAGADGFGAKNEPAKRGAIADGPRIPVGG